MKIICIARNYAAHAAEMLLTAESAAGGPDAGTDAGTDAGVDAESDAGADRSLGEKRAGDTGRKAGKEPEGRFRDLPEGGAGEEPKGRSGGEPEGEAATAAKRCPGEAARREAWGEPLGGAAEETEPVWFLKPDTALLRNNDPFYIPAFSRQVDYECELVVRISRVGRAIAERFAHRYYDQVGLGIDFTARDIQRRAIAEGLPWERAKAFDHSAAISPTFVPLAELGGDVQRLRFTLEVNGRVCQRGDTAQMLFGVDRLIAAVSRQMTLRMGDLLFTGTPAGVGPVHPGDNLRGMLGGRELLNFDIR